jgi:hypothetical protein
MFFCSNHQLIILVLISSIIILIMLSYYQQNNTINETMESNCSCFFNSTKNQCIRCSNCIWNDELHDCFDKNPIIQKNIVRRCN